MIFAFVSKYALILFFGRGRGRGARSPAKANDYSRTSEAGFAVK